MIPCCSVLELEALSMYCTAVQQSSVLFCIDYRRDEFIGAAPVAACWAVEAFTRLLEH